MIKVCIPQPTRVRSGPCHECVRFPLLLEDAGWCYVNKWSEKRGAENLLNILPSTLTSFRLNKQKLKLEAKCGTCAAGLSCSVPSAVCGAVPVLLGPGQALKSVTVRSGKYRWKETYDENIVPYSSQCCIASYLRSLKSSKCYDNLYSVYFSFLFRHSSNKFGL